MPVDKLTSAQFQNKLRTAILNRTKRYDTAYGPLLDGVLRPVGNVLEDQNNNRLRLVSLLLSLENEDEFTEADLDALVYNEGILRPEGSQATATLTFKRTSAFGAGENGRIQRGFPVATSTSETTGQPVVFVTTEAKDKTNAVSVIDPDTNQLVYEVNVPAIALVKGSAGKVSADRINRPLRSLGGYTSVTNKEATQAGRDRYSNSELIQLYLLAVASRQLSVPRGIEFYIKDNYPAVEDIHEVFGTDPLLVRGSNTAGAVDAFIVGETLVTQTDALTFLGAGQTMAISAPPLVSINQVESGGTVYNENDDYEVVFDSSGVSGSTRAVDGIRFLSTATSPPAVGDTVNVTYTYNQLIRTLQADGEDREVKVNGRDLLYRRGTRVDIFLNANLTVVSGFTASTIQTAVEAAVIDYIGSLGLGDDVEASDLQGAVRRLSGVDNFVITKLTTSASATGTTDLSIAANQYPRLDSVNVTITVM